MTAKANIQYSNVTLPITSTSSVVPPAPIIVNATSSRFIQSDNRSPSTSSVTNVFSDDIRLYVKIKPITGAFAIKSSETTTDISFSQEGQIYLQQGRSIPWTDNGDGSFSSYYKLQTTTNGEGFTVDTNGYITSLNLGSIIIRKYSTVNPVIFTGAKTFEVEITDAALTNATTSSILLNKYSINYKLTLTLNY